LQHHATVGGEKVTAQQLAQPPAHPKPRLGALLALGGLAGPLVFVTLVLIGGALYDGYSHVSQAVSELGGEGSEVARLQNTNFILLGVLTLGLAWALAGVLGGWRYVPALVAVFATSSAIANGFLPCDLGCQGTTTVGLLHNVTGVTGFVAAITATFLLSRRWRDDPHWRSHARFSRLTAYIALAGLLGFIVTRAAEIEEIDGLLQRVFVLALLTWLAVTGLRLHLAYRRGVSAPAPALAPAAEHGA
jgi:hypothetical protein